jgi:hypothetical protein
MFFTQAASNQTFISIQLGEFAATGIVQRHGCTPDQYGSYAFCCFTHQHMSHGRQVVCHICLRDLDGPSEQIGSFPTIQNRKESRQANG